jgi:hypothetical protein
VAASTGLPFAALYRAVAPGSVDLSTQTDHACLHATPPCTVPIKLWVVHVRVLDVSKDPSRGGRSTSP